MTATSTIVTTAENATLSMSVGQFRHAIYRSWREIGMYEAVRLLFNSRAHGSALRLP